MKNEEGHCGPLPTDYSYMNKLIKDNPPIDTKAVYGPGDDNYGRNKSPLKEHDKCVSCGKETEYVKHLDVRHRLYYVDGAGQLCKECYDRIYNAPEQEYDWDLNKYE